MAEILRELRPGITVEQLEKTEQAVAAALAKTADEVASGQYANATLLRRAVSQHMFRLLGDDEQTP